jgi:hypothetical protein
MLTLQGDAPLAVAVCEAIRSGDVDQLQRLLAANAAPAGADNADGVHAQPTRVKEEEMGIHGADPLDVVVGWMDAMRRGDLADVERWLESGARRTSSAALAPSSILALGHAQRAPPLHFSLG